MAGMTAVVCDDDPMARTVMAKLALQAGFEIASEVDSGRAALDLLEHFHPDVLVLDVAMPGMSGTEALAVAREIAPETKVVLISAFDIAPGPAKEAGAHEVVDKADFGRLVGVLERIAAKANV